MAQLDECSLAPHPEGNSVAKQDIECFNRVFERALTVIKAVDKHGLARRELAHCKFEAVDERAPVTAERRDQVLNPCVVWLRVVSAEASHLDFHNPIERIPQPQIALLSHRRWIRHELSARNACAGAQLRRHQLHRFVLWVRANAGSIRASSPRDVGWAAGIDGLDRHREDSNNLVKLHSENLAARTDVPPGMTARRPSSEDHSAQGGRPPAGVGRSCQALRVVGTTGCRGPRRSITA